MKYIRSYNESKQQLTEEEVKDFCEMNLAYLMDDGLKVLVRDYKVVRWKFQITLSLRSVENKRWDDIKDHIIPFLIHLRNEYKIVQITNTTGVFGVDKETTYDLQFGIIPEGQVSTYTDYFSLEDVIDDSVGDRITRGKVSHITIYIK